MSEKLTEKELLEILWNVCDRAVSADGSLQDRVSQAHDQLKEIVEEHFAIPNIAYIYEQLTSFLGEMSEPRIKRLKQLMELEKQQQKPKVSRGDKEEMQKTWEGMQLFLAVHGWNQESDGAINIQKLIDGVEVEDA